MPSTPVDARLDLSDPDLIADHLPLDEFAWLRRHQPVRWNPQPPEAGYGDGGYWALTRHADVTAVTRSPGLVGGGQVLVRPPAGRERPDR